jgi:hypothetical protein
MIGSHPVAALAPLEYRYALDAAMSFVGGSAAPIVRCELGVLEADIRQRLPAWADTPHAASALWAEPQADSWPDELTALANAVAPGGTLVMVASRPLACILPERRGWPGRPLGLLPGGIGRLRRDLARAGFALEVDYGIHTAAAIGLNLISRQAERWGQLAIGDRMACAARLRYAAAAPRGALATVALLVARKEYR